MSYETQALVTILKLFAWFGVLFVLLPRWIFPPPDISDRGGRFFANLARMLIAIAVIVQGLVLLHLFDFFSLVGSLAALGLGILSLRLGRLPLPELDWLITWFNVFILDALEGRPFSRLDVVVHWRAFRERWETREVDRTALAWGAVLVVVLCIGAGLRLEGARTRAAPGAPETYLHMSWTRQLVSNVLWPDGVYPEGAHAWLQAVAQFARVDEALLVRTAGGLVGLLLALGVFVCVKRLDGQWGTAVVAAAVYGIFIFSDCLPAGADRQQELHPYELGLVFLLPALTFLVEYLCTRSRSKSFLVTESLTAAFLVHPVAGLMGLLGLAAGLLAWAAGGGRDRAVVRRVAASGAAATLLGNSFWLLAWLGRRPWHRGTLDLTVAFLRPAFAPVATGQVQAGEWLLIQFIAALSLGLLLGAPGKSERRVLAGRTLGLYLLFLILLVWSAVLWLPGGTVGVRLPAPLAADKVSITLSIVAAAVFGLALGAVGRTLGDGSRWVARHAGSLGRWLGRLRPSAGTVGLSVGLVALLLAGVTVISPPLQANPGPPREPESFARVLYRFKAGQTAYNWTVVGHPEALPQVLGRGYYLSWGTFLEQYDPVEYRFDPRAPELAIPTRYVFILVEKRVFVGPEDTPADTLARAETQMALQDWVERYQAEHDDLSVYYEDESVVVYQIYRSPEVERKIIEEYEEEQFGRRE